MNKLEQEVIESGLCPKCNAPTDHHYVITGPYEGVEHLVRIHYTLNCGICGYKESRRMYIPLEAMHSLRYLLIPSVRLFLERVYLVSRVSLPVGKRGE